MTGHSIVLFIQWNKPRPDWSAGWAGHVYRAIVTNRQKKCPGNFREPVPRSSTAENQSPNASDLANVYTSLSSWQCSKHCIRLTTNSLGTLRCILRLAIVPTGCCTRHSYTPSSTSGSRPLRRRDPSGDIHLPVPFSMRLPSLRHLMLISLSSGLSVTGHRSSTGGRR